SQTPKVHFRKPMYSTQKQEKIMTNDQINLRMTTILKSERKITKEVLQLIILAELQRIPKEKAFKDTHDWLIREHGYSGPATNRRVQAARLMREVPEAGDKIAEGGVNLTTMWQTQRTIASFQKVTGKKVTTSEKRTAIQQIEGKTVGEVDQILYTLFPEA